MSALGSHSCRLVFLPLLLTAALLLPTLHLHPVYEHDHEGYPHQHTIIHADFLSVATLDHHSVRHENVALGESEQGNVSQFALSALPVRSSDSLLRSVEQGAGFFRVDPDLVQTRSVLRTQISKRDHSPPVLEFFLAPNAPRSPPSFV